MAQIERLKPEYLALKKKNDVNIKKDKSSEVLIYFRAFSYSKKEKARHLKHLPPSKLFMGIRFMTPKKSEEIEPKSTSGQGKKRKAV